MTQGWFLGKDKPSSKLVVLSCNLLLYNINITIREGLLVQTSVRYVFMSYSRKDEAVMQRIVTFLREQGINVWVDNEKLVPGTPVWEVEIEKAIRAIGAIVVLLSPDSNASIWVRREISFAERYNKRIFPVMVAGDEDTSIMLRLATSQYVDFRQNEEIGLNSLKAALTTYLEDLEAQEQREREKTEKLAREKAERKAAEKAAREKAAQELEKQKVQPTFEEEPANNPDQAVVTIDKQAETDALVQESTQAEPSGLSGYLKSIPGYIFGIFFCIFACLAWLVLMEGDIKKIAYSPDGNTLYVMRSDKVELYKANDLELTSSFGYSNYTFFSLAISPDGQTVATGMDKGIIMLRQDTKFQTLEGHEKAVGSIAFSPDGETMASGSDDDTVRLWRVSDGKLLHTLEGHTANVNSVAFSPDGMMLASGSDDHTIRVWQVSTGVLLLALEGHANQVESVAFSPKGDLLASGSWDKTIRLWHVNDGSQLPPVETAGYVLCVSFSPDGEMLASGENDNSIRIWSVSRRTLLHELKGNKGDVSTIAFSPDGETIASGSSDDTVRLWRVKDGVLIQKLDWQFRNPFGN